MNAPTMPPQPITYKVAYIRTAIILVVFVSYLAITDVYNAYQKLEAAGNPFAGLVWNALPTRLITDGFFAALLAFPVAWVAMKWVNRGRSSTLAAPDPATRIP